MGAAIISINQRISSRSNDRARALRQKERRSARSVLHSMRVDSDLSLSLERENEVSIVSERSLFFSRVIFVSFKVGYAKSEFREKRARAL